MGCRYQGATKPYKGWTATSRWWWITFAEQAKAYWGLWGPLGESMVRGVDAWAEVQRANIQLLRRTYGAGGRS